MSNREWTEQQQDVIKTHGSDIIVSAAAGSGKTAVLIERIIRMISDTSGRSTDVDRLLVVTFTKAAAAEMKDRLKAAIDKASAANPDNAHLRRQQLLLGNASIMTIDSFCSRVIRNYYQTIDLDPSFRVIDSEEEKLMQEDVLDELFEERYRQLSDSFVRLSECYGTPKSDRNLRDAVIKLYEFSGSAPWPKLWLEQCKSIYSVGTVEEFEELEWVKKTLASAKLMVEDALSLTEKSLEIIREENGPETYLDAILSDSDSISLLRKAGSYEEMHKLAAALSFVALGRKRSAGPLEDEKRELVKGYRERVKKTIGDIRDQFALSASEVLEEMLFTADNMRTLIELTEDFYDRLSLEKQKRNVLNFADVEHYVLRILLDGEGENAVPSEAARELSSMYDEICIDEYQDSNLVQELILNSIKGDNCRPYVFTVGDVKQSIYKFRMARPELFMDRYKRFSSGEGGIAIDLDRNFRSRPSVLEASNSVFSSAMHSSVGGVEYDERASLKAGRVFPAFEGDSAELHLISTEDDTEDGTDKLELEAGHVASCIRDMVRSGYPVTDNDSGELRPCRYGDFAVLIRTVSKWANVFAAVFSEAGVPVLTEVSSGFIKTLEVRLALNYIRILDNPLQDIPFAAVLYSPLAGLTADELADVKLFSEPGTGFYHACRAYAESCDNSLAAKLADFFAVYDSLRGESDMEVDRLLRRMYEVTGLRDYLLALPAGDRRVANLDILVTKAAAYAKTSYHGLFNFIRYIEKIEKLEIDFGEALEDRSADTVRIMSIHKSKGLEFPIVFVAGMGKQFNKSDSKASIIFHPDFGLAANKIDLKLRTRKKTTIRKAFARLTNEESMGEELRVLYVAMTRAKEKLIVTATVKDFEKLEKLSPGYDHTLRALTYIELLYPSVSEEYFDVKKLSAEDVLSESAEWLAVPNLQADGRHILEVEGFDEKNFDRQLEVQRAFAYSDGAEELVPTKISVSELKRRHLESLVADQEEEVEEDTSSGPEPLVPPTFMGETQKVSKGALYGTLVHLVMQLYPFEKEEVDMVEYLDSLLERGVIDADERSSLVVEKLVRFAGSELAARMSAAERAGKLYRERAFMYAIAANRVDSSYDPGKKVIIQGIIDGYFEEDGELVLMDYKTDAVSDAAELVSRYSIQLEQYKEALERITGKKVKESILYSFTLGQEIRLAVKEEMM